MIEKSHTTSNIEESLVGRLHVAGRVGRLGSDFCGVADPHPGRIRTGVRLG
jgi:hypothetical protein